MVDTVGDALPREMARVRGIRDVYIEIGPAGQFAAAMMAVEALACGIERGDHVGAAAKGGPVMVLLCPHGETFDDFCFGCERAAGYAECQHDVVAWLLGRGPIAASYAERIERGEHVVAAQSKPKDTK